jgi:hypothetical protein
MWVSSNYWYHRSIQDGNFFYKPAVYCLTLLYCYTATVYPSAFRVQTLIHHDGVTPIHRLQTSIVYSGAGTIARNSVNPAIWITQTIDFSQSLLASVMNKRKAVTSAVAAVGVRDSLRELFPLLCLDPG